MSLQLPEPAQTGTPLPPPAALDQPGQSGPDPLQTLQECIQALHGVVAVLPDPQDTQDATQALLILTRVQRRLMSENGSPAQG